MRHWTPRKHDSFKKKKWAGDNVSHCSWPPLYDWLIPWVTMGGKFELADKLFPEAPGAYATLPGHLLPVMHCEINKNLCLNLKYPCVCLCLCMCKYSLHLVYIHQSGEFHKTPQFIVQFPTHIITASSSKTGGAFLFLYQYDKRRICLYWHLYFEVKWNPTTSIFVGKNP